MAQRLFFAIGIALLTLGAGCVYVTHDYVDATPMWGVFLMGAGAGLVALCRR